MIEQYETTDGWTVVKWADNQYWSASKGKRDRKFYSFMDFMRFMISDK
jgi:hypothetical protein